MIYDLILLADNLGPRCPKTLTVKIDDDIVKINITETKTDKKYEFGIINQNDNPIISAVDRISREFHSKEFTIIKKEDELRLIVGDRVTSIDLPISSDHGSERINLRLIKNPHEVIVNLKAKNIKDFPSAQLEIDSGEFKQLKDKILGLKEFCTSLVIHLDGYHTPSCSMSTTAEHLHTGKQYLQELSDMYVRAVKTYQNVGGYITFKMHNNQPVGSLKLYHVKGGESISELNLTLIYESDFNQESSTESYSAVREYELTLDRKMLLPISTLVAKGYTTYYSCQGHIQLDGEYDSAYLIMEFSEDIAELATKLIAINSYDDDEWYNNISVTLQRLNTTPTRVMTLGFYTKRRDVKCNDIFHKFMTHFSNCLPFKK